VALEDRLSKLSEEEAAAELKALGTKSALPKIAVSGYQALGLQNYFTCGPDEVRAWTIRKGTKAPAAAGVIHTDFEKNFVCGEIMRFEDLKELGSEAAVRGGGKYNTKGKEYEVQVLSSREELILILGWRYLLLEGRKKIVQCGPKYLPITRCPGDNIP
jgi:obg-like ATPase 1